MMNIDETITEVNEMLLRIQKRLPIQQACLPEECVQQPALYADAALMSSKLNSETKKAKDLVDFTKNKIQFDARTNPEKYGLAKITEGAITNAVEINDEVMAAKKYYLEIDELNDTLKVLVTALIDRKSMIRDLVTMHVHTFYSEIENAPIPQGALGDVKRKEFEDAVIRSRKQE